MFSEASVSQSVHGEMGGKGLHSVGVCLQVDLHMGGLCRGGACPNPHLLTSSAFVFLDLFGCIFIYRQASSLFQANCYLLLLVLRSFSLGVNRPLQWNVL